MNNFLLGRVVYYYTALEWLKKEGFASFDPEESVETLSRLFCLDRNEKLAVDILLRNEMLARFTNSSELDLYIGAVRTVCVGAGLFGEKEEERYALAIKREAIGLLERLEERGTDVYRSLEGRRDNQRLTCIKALWCYLETGVLPERCLGDLKRNALLKEEADIDSLFLLTELDPQNRERYVGLLKKNTWIPFYQKSLEEILNEKEREDKGRATICFG